MITPPPPSPSGTDPYRPPPPPVHTRHGRLSDVVLTAVAVVFVGLLSFAFGTIDAPDRIGVAAASIASFVMPLALYWRRSHPVASTAVVYGTALLHLLLGAQLIFADTLVLVSLYSITVHGPVLAGRVALAGSFVGAAIQGWVLGGFEVTRYSNLLPALFATGVITVMCLLAWALGLLRRTRVAHTETLVERARRLEHERDQQAQIATAAERARIAREMHDIVAHSLSVVIAQADGGRYAAAGDPDAAVRALTTIGETGRAALADMRKILGVLRAPGDPAGTASTTTPQPIDADLDALVEQVRDSGLPCSIVRMGRARPLPPGTGLTVYRLCQEALTNVLKHGGPQTTATVMLQWGSQQLAVQVDDTGRGAAATTDGAGHGILGMRERVELFAGTFEAGPKPGGGYRVRAVIPLPRQATAATGGDPGPLAPAHWPSPPSPTPPTLPSPPAPSSPTPPPPPFQEGPR